MDCPEHGIKQVRLPWAEPNSRFTLMFERFAIDVLLETSVQGAMRILRIGWDAAWHLAERAVARGRRRKVAERMRRARSATTAPPSATAEASCGHDAMLSFN